MNKLFTIFAFALLILVPQAEVVSQVSSSSDQPVPLVEAYIKYTQIGWQDFEFAVAANLPPTSLKYQWTIDERETYETNNLKVFLSSGEHVIKVRVEDKYGNVVYDNVRLDIRFWSLRNNWVWWLLYLLIVCVIIYYWIVKLVYLFNRRRVSKQVRKFMDLLDEHGWVERIINNEIKKEK